VDDHRSRRFPDGLSLSLLGHDTEFEIVDQDRETGSLQLNAADLSSFAVAGPSS